MRGKTISRCIFCLLFLYFPRLETRERERLEKESNSLANWNINYWMRASNVMTGGREEGISVSQQTEWTNRGVSDSCDHRHESLIYVHTTCHNKDGIELGFWRTGDTLLRTTSSSFPFHYDFSPLHLFLSWWDVLSSSCSFSSLFSLLLSCVLNVFCKFVLTPTLD